MMKLELDLHGLREETSSVIEKKDKETVFLQYRLQDLQQQYTHTHRHTRKHATTPSLGHLHPSLHREMGTSG